MRTLGLLLCLFAAPQALAGVPLCCVVPGSDCCAPVTAEPEEAPCCPHCVPENEAPQETPTPTCDCPMRHTLWTTANDADTHVDPLPALADIAPIATAPRLESTPAPALRRTPHRLAAALSLPLLL